MTNQSFINSLKFLAIKYIRLEYRSCTFFRLSKKTNGDYLRSQPCFYCVLEFLVLRDLSMEANIYLSRVGVVSK